MGDYIKGLIEYWNTLYGAVGKNKITGNFAKKRIEYNFLSRYIEDRDEIVDLGCGTAQVGAMLSFTYLHIKYVGIDLSPVAIDKVKNLWGIPAKVGDVRDLPFPKNFCNRILALDLLEHIQPEDRPQVYKEMHRILRPGGLVCLNFCLDPGTHDFKFDFGFGNKDLFRLLNVLQGSFVDVTTYFLEIAGQLRHYMWIVIQKDPTRKGAIAINPKKQRLVK